MRSLLALGFFFSVPVSLLAFGERALACPQLNGHYTCTYDGQFGHKVFELDGETKTDARGQTYYVVNKKEIYTDGVQHHTDSLPILDQWADDVNYTGTCTGENTIHVVGDARVKKYGIRANLDGDLTKHSERDLEANFRVDAGLFATDIVVPCVHKRLHRHQAELE
jgi:hypothetical protein